jgi:hypothetical protein
MGATKRWYLVLIQFSQAPDENLKERLRSVVPTIDATLKKLSDDQCKVVQRSDTGQLVVWALHTTADSRELSARVYNPEGTKTDHFQRDQRAPDNLRAADKIAVFELGHDRWLTGINAIKSWLDRTWSTD